MGKYLIDLRDSSQENIFHHLIKNAKKCIIDFYADWCGPCVRLGESLEKTLNEHEKLTKNLVLPTDNLLEGDITDKVAIVKVNIDSFEELSQIYSVNTIPHIIIYNNGVLESGIKRTAQDIINELSK